MNWLEFIGLITLLYLGLKGYDKLKEKWAEDERILEQLKIESNELMASYREEQERKLEQEKKEALKAQAIIKKQKAFNKKWKNVDPEEEYLIRVGKINSRLFDPGLYKPLHPSLTPWRSFVEGEKNLYKIGKAHLAINIDDIIKKYGIPIDDLALLYIGYINEFRSDERKFTEKELKIENVTGVQTFPRTPSEKGKANVHQITLHRIVQTLEKLRKIAKMKNTEPVYVQARDEVL